MAEAGKTTITIRQLVYIIIFVVTVTASAVGGAMAVKYSSDKQMDTLSARVDKLELEDKDYWNLLKNRPSKLMKTRKGVVESVDLLESMMDPKNENGFFVQHNKLANILEKDHPLVLKNTKMLNPKNRRGIYWHLLVTQDFLSMLTKDSQGNAFDRFIKAKQAQQ